MKYTNDEIYSLVKKLSELDITELTVKSEDLTIKIKHGGNTEKPITKKIEPKNGSMEEIPEHIAEAVVEGKAIAAPIHGTYYSAPGPDEPCFVKQGQKVKKGEPVCILEAMKMMNTINMPEDGIILAIDAKNEDIVEAGQTLVRYESL